MGIRVRPYEDRDAEQVVDVYRDAYEVLRSKYLLLEEEALKALEERFGNG